MSYWYLATPYTNYPEGRDAAFEHAAELAAKLQEQGFEIFSPICHTHPISKYIETDNHNYWLRRDYPFMRLSVGMIVGRLPGWETSKGILQERELFAFQQKPVIDIWPDFKLLPSELSGPLGRYPT